MQAFSEKILKIISCFEKNILIKKNIEKVKKKKYYISKIYTRITNVNFKKQITIGTNRVYER